MKNLFARLIIEPRKKSLIISVQMSTQSNTKEDRTAHFSIRYSEALERHRSMTNKHLQQPSIFYVFNEQQTRSFELTITI